ncbi:fumarate reductase, flavoprotein subunit precursor [Geomicrobium sp. JCM 19037]|uniref:NADPH-dependent FMN reductase n=1 Tax=Geomicrobium sp. JCM 19037 TaxID=1460634 RepID=UPI00045F3630|nr:NAD(P)H-dependent oxidoreductase [Geomicrobium sp. JCM 19037]GAK03687.1 fumarate reductase, flavoprotein subunit precursor [Geomicrobium sp. JCM 19037]
MKIAVIVGSTRKDSYNMHVSKYMKERYTDKMDMNILNIADLPLYNQDTENTPTDAVVNFKAEVKSADAVLWVTPEHNATIPAALKNAIDWLSRVDKVMIGKPSWIIGASMGTLGSVKAQAHLRDILFAPGLASPVLPGNEVYIGAVHTKLDEIGQLIDEGTVQYLDTVVSNVTNWIKGLNTEQ